jgi:hypothetical protein
VAANDDLLWVSTPFVARRFRDVDGVTTVIDPPKVLVPGVYRTTVGDGVDFELVANGVWQRPRPQ